MLDGSCFKEFVLVPAHTRAGEVWALTVLCPFREMLTRHNGVLWGEM